MLLVLLPALVPVQIMPPFDPEMVHPMQKKLKAKGVELCLGDSVKGFKADQVLQHSCMVLADTLQAKVRIDCGALTCCSACTCIKHPDDVAAPSLLWIILTGRQRHGEML